ncbi:hypothetical protein [Pseudoalteromonas sp.]|uniref:hypothetical protein n=1 Tax=Pseudoalteromonas sp. TaxID=53249 RepID=UPI00260A164E|nr:hypothetical protein [Pseudoalteromonas sp.]MCP4585352.1 hypothetical protein [Pseudoalteromonas sp.]
MTEKLKKDATLILSAFKHLITAIDIMDRKGRSNPGYNSSMLWHEQWKNLRSEIFIAHELLRRIETNE